MKHHSPFLYFPSGRLSLTELSAARLDGDLVELGNGYTPADTVETMALRAGSLAPLAGITLALTHTSAAWVYGVFNEPPTPHHLQRAVPHRITHVIDGQICYHDSALPSGDQVLIGGVRVSTAIRTLVDLARSPDPDVHAATEELAALLPPGITAAALNRVLFSKRFSGKRAALQRLQNAHHRHGNPPDAAPD